MGMEVLDGLYRQTKYEQIAVECALEIITAAFGSVPEGVQEKLEACRKGRVGQADKPMGIQEQERVR